MTTLRQRVLVTGLLAGAALATTGAWAQSVQSVQSPPTQQTQSAAPAPGAEQQPRLQRGDPAQRFARMQEHRARRLADLKGKLKLDASQEGAWTAFTASTQPPAGAFGPRPGRDDDAKLTTPQRLEKMQAHQAERSARFARRADATRSFYAALKPEQQKTFDAETLHLGHGRPGGHGGRDGHRSPPPPAKG